MHHQSKLGLAQRLAALGSSIFALVRSKRARNKLIQKLIETPKAIKKSRYVLVSFPKSGRTWVRAMLTRLYHTRFGTPDNLLIRLDNLSKLDSRIPTIFFTHDGDSSGSVSRLDPDKSIYDGRNIVFLARHPADVIVSRYFHDKHRKAHKRENSARESDLFSFATRPNHGLHTVIHFMNHWMAYAKHNPRVLVVRYEDLRKDPTNWLKRITDHFGGDFTAEELDDAVEFGKFDNLKKLERIRYFNDRHLQATDNDDPQSYKVRSGKVLGYRHHLTAMQVQEIDAIIKAELDAAFEY